MIAESQLDEVIEIIRSHLGDQFTVGELLWALSETTAYRKNKSFRDTIDAMSEKMNPRNPKKIGKVK